MTAYRERLLAGEYAAPDAEQEPSSSSSSEPMAEVSAYEGMTNAELQGELASRGLPTYGAKADLIARLEEADAG